MIDLASLVVAALGGGGTTVLAQAVNGWWKGRGDRYKVDADIAEHRDNLTLELLKAARDEAAAARAETVSVHLVHLEEALDHIYALLHADGPEEKRAAERRAKAFLRRMRPEVGDLRNQIQTIQSAAELARRNDAAAGGEV